MKTVFHELFRFHERFPYRPLASSKLFFNFLLPKTLLIRFVPENIPQEFQLKGWFLMGELTRKTTLITVFWTMSHPQYDHSLILISKMSPFSAQHLLVGCMKNVALANYDTPLWSMVVDAFGILSPGLNPFLRSLPTWFFVTQQKNALVYLIVGLSMMLNASPRHRRKISKLVERLEAFKGRPWDRVTSRKHRAERATAVSASSHAGKAAKVDLGRLYDFVSRPEFFKGELEMLAEKPERFDNHFHESANVHCELKEAAHYLERWYKLMLEPGYLAAEVKATLSSWHQVSLEGRLPQGSRKHVRNDILRLLEFLCRLKFDFAETASVKVRAVWPNEQMRVQAP